MKSFPSLGPRLNAIFDLVAKTQTQQEKRYDCIWDCCCDHGYLGFQLLRDVPNQTLYFVDQIPHLIDDIKARLLEFPSANAEAITADVSTLEFTPEKRHLVILAGVGGEHIIDILDGIERNHPHGSLDFLFCPTTTQYDLREYLVKHNFALAYEAIVTEKNRDYEIIYVRGKANTAQATPVSLTGNMWNGKHPEHRRYLTKLITHYENRSRGNLIKGIDDESNRRILEIYRDQREQLNAA
jgi:tRNA (adenine22-N1)-methyltransferase